MFARVLAAALLPALVACSSDSEEPSETASDAGADSASNDHEHDGHDHEEVHQMQSASCQEIMDLCHPIDQGRGRISECHDLALDDDEAACAARKAECIDVCTL